MGTITFEDLPKAVSELLQKVNDIQEHLLGAGISGKEEQEGLLTISEAGKLLDLSKNTIYKLVQSRTLPYSKRGKRLYFLKQELLEFVKAGKIKTHAELSIEAESILITKNKKRSK
jgi:excisionase family DNA binding protein